MRLGRIAPLLLLTGLAGCGSFGAVGLGPMDRQAAEPDTLPPVASTPVEKTALPPPPGQTETAMATDPNAQPGAMPAPAAPTAPPAASVASGAEIGRTDLLGGWTLSSGADSCQLFMTLTSWTGGYRASTRGCQNPTLKSISAWSLSGSDVVLAGSGGTPVARLSSAGNNHFNGQTISPAQPISFYR